MLPGIHLVCFQDGISTRAIPESEMVGDLMALQVQFGLPSGCYATVALRQITGTDMGKQSMKVSVELQDVHFLEHKVLIHRKLFTYG